MLQAHDIAKAVMMIANLSASFPGSGSRSRFSLLASCRAGLRMLLKDDDGLQILPNVLEDLNQALQEATAGTSQIPVCPRVVWWSATSICQVAQSDGEEARQALGSAVYEAM